VIINIFQTVKKTGVPFQINPNKIQNKLCEWLLKTRKESRNSLDRF
jgi:hypothetical protein